MAIKKTKTRLVSRKVGKPAGMNYAEFLQWQQALYEEAKEAAISDLTRVLADRQGQRVGWLYLVALNEKFDFDADQSDELEATVKAMSEEYAQNVQNYDQDYADEDLRRRVCQVLGKEVKYLYEDQYPINMDKACNPISNLRESESRIY